MNEDRDRLSSGDETIVANFQAKHARFPSTSTMNINTKVNVVKTSNAAVEKRIEEGKEGEEMGRNAFPSSENQDICAPRDDVIVAYKQVEVSPTDRPT